MNEWHGCIISPTRTHSYQNQRDSVAHPSHRCGFERTDRTQADEADRLIEAVVGAVAAYEGRSFQFRSLSHPQAAKPPGPLGRS